MPRFVTPALRAGFAALALAAGIGTAAAEEAKVTFVLTNDLYNMSEEHGHGGLARLAAVVKAERAKGGTVVFVHAGDAFSPCLLCGFDHGEHMVALLNEIAPDVFVPGNHEFDFGKETYAKRRSEAKFPFYAANLRGPDGQPLPGHKDHTIVDVNGVKIGIVGLALDITPNVSSSGDLKFAPAIETLKTEAKALREAGADLVVAATHTDRDTDFRIMDSGLADLLLTGHDHDLRVVYDGKRAMAESGADAEYVIAIDVAIDAKGAGKDRKVAWHPNFRIVDTATVTPDPVMAGKVKVYEAELSKELDVPLATTTVDLDSRTASVRSRETNFADLVADALKASTGADVAITNGGGLRADTVYATGTELTRRDILKEMPFGNATGMVELSGADIKAALENGVSQLPSPAGRFPQVSGLAFTVDPMKAPGSRVSNVMVNGKPLDETARYTVATNDFMLRGSDGYAALTRGKPLVGGTDGKLMAGEVMAYLRKLGTIATPAGNRIVVK